MGWNRQRSFRMACLGTVELPHGLSGDSGASPWLVWESPTIFNLVFKLHPTVELKSDCARWPSSAGT